MDEVYNAICSDKAEFIGQGDWIKDTAYQVYKYQDKYYVIIACGQMESWLEKDTLKEITAEELPFYIGR